MASDINKIYKLGYDILNGMNSINDLKKLIKPKREGYVNVYKTDFGCYGRLILCKVNGKWEHLRVSGKTEKEAAKKLNCLHSILQMNEPNPSIGSKELSEKELLKIKYKMYNILNKLNDEYETKCKTNQ